VEGLADATAAAFGDADGYHVRTVEKMCAAQPSRKARIRRAGRTRCAARESAAVTRRVTTDRNASARERVSAHLFARENGLPLLVRPSSAEARLPAQVGRR
jgi:hypothetical protein